MRTTERMLYSSPAITVEGFTAAFTARVKSVLRGLRNRKALSQLQELDDHHLRDLGLTRRDLAVALDNTHLLDDPFDALPRIARRRKTGKPARSR